jgi:hypothetical protein
MGDKPEIPIEEIDRRLELESQYGKDNPWANDLFTKDSFKNRRNELLALKAALEKNEVLEEQLTNFHAAIDELSIGVASHAVKIFYSQKPGGPTTTCNPNQVRGVFEAVRKHASCMGDFGPRAVWVILGAGP